MAQHVNVSFVDDLDGGEADGTVSFALDGTVYEIDLSGRNLEKLREILAPYVDAGRRTGGASRAPRPASARTSDREQNQAIREWAQAQGLSISTRGRMSSEVIRAYRNRDEVAGTVAAVDAGTVASADAGTAEQPRRASTVQQPTFSGAPASA